MHEASGSIASRPTFVGVPENEIPARVPLRLVFAHTERIAVWLTGVDVFSTCITMVPGNVRLRKPEAGHTPPTLLGFESSDGVRSTNLPGKRAGLEVSGGGGIAGVSRIRFLLQPVSPAGPLTVHFAWPHFDIDESTHRIDANEFSEAKRCVEKLWNPVDTSSNSQIDFNDRTLPELKIPEHGWFAESFELERLPPCDPAAPQRINFAFSGDDGPNE